MRRTFAHTVQVLALLAAVALPAAADGDAPFPAGESQQELHGLQWTVVMPERFDPSSEHSLVVVLHGLGGPASGMARSLAFLAPEDYVVVAPKSRGQGWEADDLERVRATLHDLVPQLHVGANRLHGIGFSNGGWNLASVVFDEELRYTSATWVAAGYQGGKPPKYAKKGMGVLALAGSLDGNRKAAEDTPRLLGEDVRSAEVRIEEGIGHEWPKGQMPYYGWWLGVQEGRFVPGVTLAFAWDEAAEAVPAPSDDGKSGSFVYWYADADTESADAKAFQNEVLQDPAVRFFGGQCRAAKRERAAHAEEFDALKLAGTPAVVVYDTKGKLKKALAGDVSAKSLAAALRSVAAVKKLPD